MQLNSKDQLLSQVKSIIKESLISGDINIKSVYSFLTENSGKMVRPILYIEASKLFGPLSQNDLKISASFEMIHLASLLHDDVIDESKLRRGKESIWEKWDINTAVLAGDMLWCKAFDLLFEIVDKNILKIVLNSTFRMVEGELMDNFTKNKISKTIDRYFSSISSKTASLFEGICKTAACCHDVSNIMINLGLFGYNYGMAFQIMDDIKDLTSSDETLGKPIFNDLKQRKTTLPLIIAINQASKTEMNDLKSVMDSDESYKTKANVLINKYNGIEESKIHAKKYISEAIDSLKPLSKNYNVSGLICLANELVY